jgi:hypothetical protein
MIFAGSRALGESVSQIQQRRTVLAPADIATIYNVNLFRRGFDGSEIIAVAGRPPSV